MIEPLSRGEPFPGRRATVREQWRELPGGTRVAALSVPLVIIAAVLAVNLAAGVAVAVLLIGAAAATVTYVKNRTDRHNAAIDRGELRVPDDPHLARVDTATLDRALLQRLADLGYGPGDLGQAKRFDGGWIAKHRNLRDIAVVVGDDGGIAYFDPRWVPDVHAATQYLAGNGREEAV